MQSCPALQTAGSKSREMSPALWAAEAGDQLRKTCEPRARSKRQRDEEGEFGVFQTAGLGLLLGRKMLREGQCFHLDGARAGPGSEVGELKGHSLGEAGVREYTC